MICRTMIAIEAKCEIGDGHAAKDENKRKNLQSLLATIPPLTTITRPQQQQQKKPNSPSPYN